MKVLSLKLPLLLDDLLANGDSGFEIVILFLRCYLNCF